MQTKRLTNDFTPVDPKTESFQEAHELFKDMRGKCPVAHSEGLNGFWALFGYEDVVNVLKDPKTFVTSVQNVVPKVATTGRRPPLHLDPPEHTPYRRTLDPFLRDEKMEKMKPLVYETIIELIEPFVAKGGGDISEELFHKLPGYVMAHFFNLPPDLSMKIRDVTKRFAGSLYEMKNEQVQQASLELYEIARNLIDMRKKEPMDPDEDVISAYLAREYNGEPLPDDLILGTIRQLMVVGMIAPVVFSGSMWVHLTENPHIQNQLRNNLSLVPAAIEEYLRMFTPYRGFARTPNEDVEIGGRTIKKDEPIALVFASANRDETVFPDPDEFILNRPNIKKHIAFGLGPHRCPGEPLARMMLTITLKELLARTNNIEKAGDVKMAGWPEWGVLSLPVKVS